LAGAGLDWLAVEGLLDWYLLGVVIGLAVPAGLAAFRKLATLGSAAVVGAAVAIVALALPWWALGAFAVSGLLAWFFLRHLSSAAVPAAFLMTALVALVPALGYALPALAPVAGGRLGRQAGSRYAGLRILARD
jgi:uncharacterized membrane protein YwzB